MVTLKHKGLDRGADNSKRQEMDSQNTVLSMYYTYMQKISWKQPRCPSTEEWIQKNVVLPIMEVFSWVHLDQDIEFPDSPALFLSIYCYAANHNNNGLNL